MQAYKICYDKLVVYFVVCPSTLYIGVLGWNRLDVFGIKTWLSGTVQLMSNRGHKRFSHEVVQYSHNSLSISRRLNFYPSTESKVQIYFVGDVTFNRTINFNRPILFYTVEPLSNDHPHQ